VSLVFKRTGFVVPQRKLSLFVQPGCKRVINEFLFSPENANEFVELANQRLSDFKDL